MLFTLMSAYGVFLLAVISPGPDFVITVQSSLRHGVRAGIWTALGIALANLIHIAYVHVGIGALIAHSLLAFTILKLLAAGYLIYLGVGALRSTPQGAEAMAQSLAQPGAASGSGSAFRQGFVTNALNPKAALFWLSYLTLVIDATMPTALLFGFISLLITTAFIWFSLVAYFLSRRTVRERFLRCGHWFDRVTGAVLVGLGIKVALSAR